MNIHWFVLFSLLRPDTSTTETKVALSLVLSWLEMETHVFLKHVVAKKLYSFERP